MPRIHIKDLHEHIGKEVEVSGWVDVRRDHGKLIFLDVRDVTGTLQVVVLPSHPDAHKVAGELRPEWTVAIKGNLNKRPDKMVNHESPTGDVELEALEITALSKAEELPFNKDVDDINIDTYLDYLPFTLRRGKSRAMLKIQAAIIDAFRTYLEREGFVEIQVPKLTGGDAEGGAAVFEVKYFDHKAYLATSPQLYKQIMVGVLERVFTTTSVYRAEKHSTSRHLNEYTSMDLEMGFIESHEDIMDLEEGFLKFLFEELKGKCANEIKLLDAKIPDMTNAIPRMKLREAQEILEKEFGQKCLGEPDLEPQHERMMCEYAEKKYSSEFIFITHYPVKKRPFYTYEDEADPGFTKSFDMLFRGLEVTTGGQRIHEYGALVENIKKWGLDPEHFSFYLQAFKYGMPPEGGLAIGLERLTARILGLDNVKEATLFPRDLNRIDTLLSDQKPKEEN